MKKDDMIMKMGIVHILDSVVGMPVLSDCPIDMGSNLCDFLKAHIEKFTESDDMKVCQFSDESEVMGLIISAQETKPSVPDGFVWPECPKRRQSHVLFDDGYEEGWAACVATIKAMANTTPEAKP